MTHTHIIYIYRFHSTLGSKLLTLKISVSDLLSDHLTDFSADVNTFTFMTATHAINTAMFPTCDEACSNKTMDGRTEAPSDSTELIGTIYYINLSIYHQSHDA